MPEATRAPHAGPGRRRPLLLAHRGDWRRAPENSLAAFEAALALPGCDGLELDVRLSRDAIPVVIHDATLARVQRRPDRVADLPAAELAEAGVPSLADVLELVARRRPAAFLDIELKGDDHGEATAAVLGPHAWRGVVSSFEPPALEALARLLPDVPRWLNADDLAPGTVATAVSLGCAAVSVEWHALDAAAVERARSAGLDVAAWTVRDDDGTIERLAALGVAAVCVEGDALELAGRGGQG